MEEKRVSQMTRSYCPDASVPGSGFKGYGCNNDILIEIGEISWKEWKTFPSVPKRSNQREEKRNLSERGQWSECERVASCSSSDVSLGRWVMDDG
jgi:hypothetical protein